MSQYKNQRIHYRAPGYVLKHFLDKYRGQFHQMENERRKELKEQLK